MNILKTILSGIFLLLSLTLSAQKTEVVPDLPYSNKILVNDQVLESLFHLTDTVSVEIGTGLRLEGKIVNKTKHGNSGTSLLIKTNNHTGGTLSISRNTDPQGKIFYSGRLLKLHDASGFTLVEKDQHYYFIETQQRFLVSE